VRGQKRSSAARIAGVLQTKMPAFQRKRPLRMNSSARARSGFSTKRETPCNSGPSASPRSM
jgi:hypothetical protein